MVDHNASAYVIPCQPSGTPDPSIAAPIRTVSSGERHVRCTNHHRHGYDEASARRFPVLAGDSTPVSQDELFHHRQANAGAANPAACGVSAW